MDNKRSGPPRAVNLLLDGLYTASMAVAMLGLLVVVTAVSWQVLTRYLTSTPAPWAPELAQVAFVWSALLAIAVGVRQDKHMVVDAFTAVKSRVGTAVLNTITTATIIAVSATLAWFGYDSLTVSFRRTFPALGIATGWMHLAVPVAFSLCVVFAIEIWARKTFGTPTMTEDSTHRTIEAFDESGSTAERKV